MIDFRYHLVSIIAIFFALATGIALGAGPLKPGIDQQLTQQTEQLRDENQSLRDQVAALERSGQLREAFLASVSGQLVDDALARERVVLVALPGAHEDALEGLAAVVEDAGATVSATIRVLPAWTDPGEEATLDQLATSLVQSGTTLPEGTAYDRAGAVLASALVGEEPDEEPTPGSRQILSALVEAEFLEFDGDPPGRAGSAIVVAGGSGEGEDAGGAADRLVALVRALDAAGGGATVMGPPASAGEHATVGTIRADADLAKEVSTVDTGEVVSGWIATVFAQREQLAGGVGHYGSEGTTDGPMPTATPTAAP